MELYIEKEFLDNFYTNFSNEPEELIFSDILKRYGDKIVYMDYVANSIEELEALKKENEYFAYAILYSSMNKVVNLKNHVLSKSSFEQTLIFMNEDENWLSEASEKGALCFTYKNFKTKIKEIKEKLHFKIDLSEKPFGGWGFLSSYEYLNFNHLTITDGYILSDKSNQKLDNNLIPILNSFLSKERKNIKIDILTIDLKPLSSADKHKEEKAKERCETIIKKVSNVISNLTIIMNDPFVNKYDFHDRIIQTNFSLLECGKGFNLSRSKLSNSQIISETIFEYHTYKRLKNHKNMQSQYIDKLKGDGFSSNKFFIYSNN